MQGGALALISFALQSVNKVVQYMATDSEEKHKVTQDESVAVKLIAGEISKHFFLCNPETDKENVEVHRKLRTLQNMLIATRQQVFLASHGHDLTDPEENSSIGSKVAGSAVLAKSDPCTTVGGFLREDTLVTLAAAFFSDVLPHWGWSLVGANMSGCGEDCKAGKNCDTPEGIYVHECTHLALNTRDFAYGKNKCKQLVTNADSEND